MCSFSTLLIYNFLYFSFGFFKLGLLSVFSFEIVPYRTVIFDEC